MIVFDNRSPAGGLIGWIETVLRHAVEIPTALLVLVEICVLAAGITDDLFLATDAHAPLLENCLCVCALLRRWMTHHARSARQLNRKPEHLHHTVTRVLDLDDHFPMPCLGITERLPDSLHHAARNAFGIEPSHPIGLGVRPQALVDERVHFRTVTHPETVGCEPRVRKEMAELKRCQEFLQNRLSARRHRNLTILRFE